MGSLAGVFLSVHTPRYCTLEAAFEGKLASEVFRPVRDGMVAQGKVVARAGLDVAGGPGVERVAALLRDRAATLAEMADAARYFYEAPAPDPAMLAEQINDANRPVLGELHNEFATIDWARATLGSTIKAAAARHKLKPPQLMMPLRALVAGTLKTPAIDAVLELVGREATRARMARGLDFE
jgi:glutamyl-tRNA synthetase